MSRAKTQNQISDHKVKEEVARRGRLRDVWLGAALGTALDDGLP